MYAFKEKSVGMLVFGGCGTAFICGCGTWFLLVGLGISGIRFGTNDPTANRVLYGGVTITLLGLLAVVIGIAWGVYLSRTEFRGNRSVVQQARVIARYALDREDLMHTDEYVISALDRPRFFVRLDTGIGETVEYQCPEVVFWQAGEGMNGEAEIQGKWLGSFRPHFGREQGRQDDRVPSL